LVRGFRCRTANLLYGHSASPFKRQRWDETDGPGEPSLYRINSYPQPTNHWICAPIILDWEAGAWGVLGRISTRAGPEVHCASSQTKSTGESDSHPPFFMVADFNTVPADDWARFVGGNGPT